MAARPTAIAAVTGKSVDLGGGVPQTSSMADVISLSKVRKQKARADKEATAVANRAQFGRTKAEKQKAAAEKAIADKIIDAHRRET